MNRTRGNNNQQDRSLRPPAERAIGKPAAANWQEVVRILGNARLAGNSQGRAVAAAPEQTHSTPEKSTHKSRNNRRCRPEFAPAHAIWSQQARRVVRLRAGFAPKRADGRGRRRPRSGAPARSAPAPRRVVYGDKPNPSPSTVPNHHASVTSVTFGKRRGSVAGLEPDQVTKKSASARSSWYVMSLRSTLARKLITRTLPGTYPFLRSMRSSDAPAGSCR